MPKAELHVHIEGTLEAELCFELARRNDIELAYNSVAELQSAYQFNNLQEFLDIYYQGAEVLIEEQDFFDLTWAYLEKARSQNVLHAEIFFDPQTHTMRGVEMDTMLNGMTAAMKKAETALEISSRLIFCILHHVEIGNALDTAAAAEHYKERYAPYLIGIGLDSAEVGFPPHTYKDVFDRTRAAGGEAVHAARCQRLIAFGKILEGFAHRYFDRRRFFVEPFDKHFARRFCEIDNRAGAIDGQLGLWYPPFTRSGTGWRPEHRNGAFPRLLLGQFEGVAVAFHPLARHLAVGNLALLHADGNLAAGDNLALAGLQIANDNARARRQAFLLALVQIIEHGDAFDGARNLLDDGSRLAGLGRARGHQE
jgi:hypothetical protein